MWLCDHLSFELWQKGKGTQQDILDIKLKVKTKLRKKKSNNQVTQWVVTNIFGEKKNVKIGWGYMGLLMTTESGL